MTLESYSKIHSSIRKIPRIHMKNQSNPLFMLHSVVILMESLLETQNKLMNQNGWHAECQCVTALLPQPIYIFHMRPKWGKEVIVCPPRLHRFPQETILVKSQGNSNSSPLYLSSTAVVHSHPPVLNWANFSSLRKEMLNYFKW